MLAVIGMHASDNIPFPMSNANLYEENERTCRHTSEILEILARGQSTFCEYHVFHKIE